MIKIKQKLKYMLSLFWPESIGTEALDEKRTGESAKNIATRVALRNK